MAIDLNCCNTFSLLKYGCKKAGFAVPQRWSVESVREYLRKGSVSFMVVRTAHRYKEAICIKPT